MMMQISADRIEQVRVFFLCYVVRINSLLSPNAHDTDDDGDRCTFDDDNADGTLLVFVVSFFVALYLPVPNSHNFVLSL